MPRRKPGQFGGIAVSTWITAVVGLLAGFAAIAVATVVALNAVRPMLKPPADLPADAAAGPTAWTAAPELPVVPAAVPRVPAAPKPLPKLPAGWVWNGPGYGFRAPWPVAAGPDGFAPPSVINPPGTKMWGASDAERTIFGINVTEPIGIETVPPAEYADRYARRLMEKGNNPSARLRTVTLAGRTGREIASVPDRGGIHLLRLVVDGPKLWLVSATLPAPADEFDPRAAIFFDYFRFGD